MENLEDGRIWKLLMKMHARQIIRIFSRFKCDSEGRGNRCEASWSRETDVVHCTTCSSSEDLQVETNKTHKKIPRFPVAYIMPPDKANTVGIDDKNVKYQINQNRFSDGRHA